MDQNLNYSETIGGWQSLQIANLDEVTFCPAILTNKNAHKISITGRSDTMDFLPSIETGAVSVRTVRTSSGYAYRIKITIEINYASPEIDDYFNFYQNKKVVVLGIDNMNRFKFYGSKTSPLFFNFSVNVAKNQEQSSKTIINIEGETTQKPVYILPPAA